MDARQLRIDLLIEYLYEDPSNGIKCWVESRVRASDVVACEEYPSKYRPIPISEHKLLELGWRKNGRHFERGDWSGLFLTYRM